MQKVVCILAGLLLFLTIGYGNAQADMTEKLKEGFKKVITAPLNVSDGINEEYKEAEFKPFGVIGGIVQGLFYTGKDILIGVLEMVTFPIDFEK